MSPETRWIVPPRQPSRFPVSIAVLFALFLGAVVMYGMLAARGPHVTPVQAESATPAPVAVPETVLDLQQAIVRASESISKCVVNIDTTAYVRTDPFGPFGRQVPFGFPERIVPQKGQGSGLIVSSDGLILTNDHVVRGASEIKVRLPDKREVKGVVKGGDRLSDIALVKIDEKNLPAAPLGDSDSIPIGSFVIAVGNPFGFSHTVTVGVLSGREREIPEPGKEFRNLLQTDAAINPGNSGGPLLDLSGRVIGINTAIIPQAQGLSFAIPINSVKETMQQLTTRGKVIRAYIGVVMHEMNDDVAQYLGMPKTEGVLVRNVVRDSPAHRAGLSQGDVLLEMDGRRVEDLVKLQQQIRQHKPGEEITLKVWSERKVKTVKLRVAEMPDMPDR